jgi:hypothetical protein
MDRLDRQALRLAARLERERAQKAQYTAMILRACAHRTREEHLALRLAFEAFRESCGDRAAAAPEPVHLPDAACTP